MKKPADGPARFASVFINGFIVGRRKLLATVKHFPSRRVDRTVADYQFASRFEQIELLPLKNLPHGVVPVMSRHRFAVN